MSIVLWTSWYNVTPEEHYKECIRAIELNCENPHISKIMILCESELLITHPKIECIAITERPTYGTFLKYFIDSEDYNILINTDIVLDYSTTHYFKRLTPNSSYMLSRYNITSDVFQPMNIWESYYQPCPFVSQDTWAFYKPIIQNIKPLEDILMGINGCDNRIAYEIYRANIVIRNPSLTIKTYHLHKSEYRNDTGLTYKDKGHLGIYIKESRISSYHFAKDLTTQLAITEVTNKKLPVTLLNVYK